MPAEQKLREMGLELSDPNPPVANFVSSVRTGNLLYVAGHIPRMADGSVLHQGKVGREVTGRAGLRGGQASDAQLLVCRQGGYRRP